MIVEFCQLPSNDLYGSYAGIAISALSFAAVGLTLIFRNKLMFSRIN